MPVYDYMCTSCGSRVDVYHTIAECTLPRSCGCGGELVRQLSAPRILTDYTGYSCPVTGDWIEGRAAHRANLSKHGCRVLEPGETEATRQARVSEEASIDHSVDQTVERFYESLPTAKREQLASEVLSGATTTLTRTTPN